MANKTGIESRFLPKPPKRGGIITLQYGVTDTSGNRLCCLCGKPVKKPRRDWCSEECVERYKLDQDWPTISWNILDRDKRTCRDCGTRKCRMEVHHVVPVSQGGTNSPDNLVTLCYKCHRKRHGKGCKK